MLNACQLLAAATYLCPGMLRVNCRLISAKAFRRCAMHANKRRSFVRVDLRLTALQQRDPHQCGRAPVPHLPEQQHQTCTAQASHNQPCTCRSSMRCPLYPTHPTSKLSACLPTHTNTKPSSQLATAHTSTDIADACGSANGTTAACWRCCCPGSSACSGLPPPAARPAALLAQQQRPQLQPRSTRLLCGLEVL